MLENLTKQFNFNDIDLLFRSTDMAKVAYAFEILEDIEDRYHSNNMMSNIEIRVMLYFTKRFGHEGAEQRELLKHSTLD